MIRQLNPILLAVACLLATAVAGLMLRPLTALDETRYLAVAWEMHQSGNWLVPTKNFEIYSHKPPILFWTINLIWLFTGVSEFAARMVGPIFGCIALVLTAVLGRGLWPQDTDVGGRAALALAGLIVFSLSASLTMFDVPLTVATLLGLIALNRAGREGAGRWPWAGFGAAIALGALTKGPVIVFHLLPAAVLLPLWAASPQSWRGLAPRIGLGLLVGLGLIALWLVPAAVLGGPEYRDAILWHQSAGRLTESFAHARPWWFFLALLPVLSFPLLWSPGLWLAGWRARRQTDGQAIGQLDGQADAQTNRHADRGLRLCMIWAGSALLLFSLTSGKQLHYLVPELPALALIAARLGRNAGRFALWPAQAVLAVLALVALAVGLGLLAPGRYEILLDPRWMLIPWALLIVGLILLTGRVRGFVGVMLTSLGLLLACNLLVGTTRTAEIYSTHPIAAQIPPEPAAGVAILGSSYNAEFNFAARLIAPVAEITDSDALTRWLEQHPQGLLIGRMDQYTLPWPPRERIPFRSREWGLWSAADASAAPTLNSAADSAPVRKEP